MLFFVAKYASVLFKSLFATLVSLSDCQDDNYYNYYYGWVRLCGIVKMKMRMTESEILKPTGDL